MKVIKSAHHRNGVCGKPFSVVLFEDEKRQMLAIVPSGDGDNGDQDNGECYVLDLALAAAGTIEFGVNSWRGDHYEHDLRQHIAAQEAAEWQKTLLTLVLQTIGYDSIEAMLADVDNLNETYGLDPDEPIGSQLALQGFLTNEQGDALDREIERLTGAVGTEEPITVGAKV